MIPKLPVWLIITIVLLLALVVMFRTMNQVYLLSLLKNNFFYFFVIAIFIFFTISLTHIHSTYDISLTSSDGVMSALNIYYNWLIHVFKNLGQITGYATKQEWLLNATETP